MITFGTPHPGEECGKTLVVNVAEFLIGDFVPAINGGIGWFSFFEALGNSIEIVARDQGSFAILFTVQVVL